MTIPNVGVSGVIQQPGIGNVLGQSLGGISNMLMQLEQFRMQQQRDNANQAFMGEQVTTMQTARKTAAQEREAAAQQAAAYQQNLASALSVFQGMGLINAGEVASLRLNPSSAASYLMTKVAPMKLGENERVVQMTPGVGGAPPAPQTLVSADTTQKPGDLTTDFRNFLASEGLPVSTRYENLSLEQRQRFDAREERIARSGAGQTTISMGENAFGRGMGEGAAAMLKDRAEKARQAAESLNNLSTLQGILDEGIISGWGANAVTNFGNALAQFGIGGDNVKDAVTRTQLYGAAVGREIGQNITLFGSGTGLSDEDRKFAAKMSGGDITMTADALKRIHRIRETQLRWIIDNNNESVNNIPSTLVSDPLKDLYRVNAPTPSQSTAPSGGQASVSGQFYDYQGQRYPVIVGSDGKRYITTANGTFQLP